MKSLTTLLLLTSLMLGATEVSAAGRVARAAILGPVEANSSVNAGSLTLIDIRRPSEWRETGVAKQARTITMHVPGGPDAFLSAVLRAVNGDVSRPVALICASGVRSTWAQRFLAARGFHTVYNVKEGMLGTGSRPGWIKRGLPVRAYVE